MNTTRRQQATGAVLALSVTLGMLFSINLLATQSASEAQLTASKATNGQTVGLGLQSPQG